MSLAETIRCRALRGSLADCTGVVDQDVDRAEKGDNPRKRLPDGVGVHDVDDGRFDSDTLASEPIGERVQGIVAIDCSNRGPFPAEVPAKLLTDALLKLR